MAKNTALHINPSKADLAGFGQWLLGNGLSSLTATAYQRNVRLAADDGIVARLTGTLAPKSLHANAAALRSYATYTDDGALLVALKKIRLPASRRKTAKVELPFETWRDLVLAIEDDAKLPPAMRSTLLIMALRGLRIGDVLRLGKDEITTAIKTKKLVFEAKGRRRLEYGIAQIKAPLEVLADDDRDWARVVDLVAWRSRKTGDAKMQVARMMCLRQLKRVAATISVTDVYNHRLRRTYATHWLRQLQGDPQAVVKLQHHMGWAEIETAMGYVDAVHREELEDMGVNLIDELRKSKPKPTRKR